MKERPILFNTEMVQAILAGRKTQTRRVMSPSHAESVAFMGGSDDEDKKFEFAAIHYDQPIDDNGKQGPAQWLAYCTEYPEEGSIPIGQGPGAIGDRLWVRETYGLEVRNYGGGAGEFLVFKASKPDATYCTTACGKSIPVKWKPSIHMPRKYCRIILEITGLRVERLNDITNADCKAEGYPADREADGGSMDPFLWFRDLWNKTGGNFNSKPWVWVIEFKVMTTNGVIRGVAA